MNSLFKMNHCDLTHKFAALESLCFQITMANLCFLIQKALENQGPLIKQNSICVNLIFYVFGTIKISSASVVIVHDLFKA